MGHGGCLDGHGQGIGEDVLFTLMPPCWQPWMNICLGFLRFDERLPKHTKPLPDRPAVLASARATCTLGAMTISTLYKLEATSCP